MNAKTLLESDPAVYDMQSSAAGPSGSLPLTEELLRNAPSGELFGWSHDVGMGWKPAELNRPEFLILSTQGGIRAPDGNSYRAGLSHRPLGSRSAHEGGRGGTAGPPAAYHSPVLSPTRATAERRARPV